MAFSKSNMLKPGIAAERTLAAGFEIDAVETTEAFTFTSLVQSWQWVIPSQCENPVATMKFLNKMYGDPEVTNLLTWGIEGKHYVFTEDGHITYPEGVDASNVGYVTSAGWEFGNQYNNYVWETDDIDVYKQLKEFNDNAIKSKAMGFTFDASNVKTEFAACKAVLDEYQRALELGIMDPETGFRNSRISLRTRALIK